MSVHTEPRLIRWTALAVALVLGGCSNGPSTRPSTTTPRTSLQWTTTTRVLSGRVVDEDGTPVPGATVVAFGSNGAECCATPSPAVTTDANGSYRTATTAPGPPFHYFGADVTVSKAGFEETHGWAAGTGDTVQDFRLFRPISLRGGDGVHLVITPESSLCGLEEEFLCRAVHVTMPSSGTLVLDAISDDPSRPVWLMLGGRSDVQSGSAHLSTFQPAGADVTIQTLVYRQTPAQGFSLRTSVAPQ